MAFMECSSLPEPCSGLSTYPACSYRLRCCSPSERGLIARLKECLANAGRQRDSERKAERCAGLTYSHLGMFPRRGGFELNPSETTVGFMTGKIWNEPQTGWKPSPSCLGERWAVPRGAVGGARSPVASGLGSEYSSLPSVYRRV